MASDRQLALERTTERAAHERARILDALLAHGGPLSARHLTPICGMTYATVRQRLGELLAEGLLRRMYGEFWEVKP